MGCTPTPAPWASMGPPPGSHGCSSHHGSPYTGRALPAPSRLPSLITPTLDNTPQHPHNTRSHTHTPSTQGCPGTAPTHMAMRRATVVPKRSKMKPMGKVMKLFMKEPMVKTRENCSSWRLQSAGRPSVGTGTRGHRAAQGIRTVGTQPWGHGTPQAMGTLWTWGTTGHQDSGDMGTGIVGRQTTAGHRDSRDMGHPWGIRTVNGT